MPQSDEERMRRQLEQVEAFVAGKDINTDHDFPTPAQLVQVTATARNSVGHWERIKTMYGDQTYRLTTDSHLSLHQTQTVNVSSKSVTQKDLYTNDAHGSSSCHHKVDTQSTSPPNKVLNVAHTDMRRTSLSVRTIIHSDGEDDGEDDELEDDELRNDGSYAVSQNDRATRHARFMSQISVKTEYLSGDEEVEPENDQFCDFADEA